MLPPIKSISLDYYEDYRNAGSNGAKSAKHYLKHKTRKTIRHRLKQELRNSDMEEDA